MNLKIPYFQAVPLLALSSEALHILSPERYILQKVKFIISFVKIHFDAEPKCLTLYRMLVKRKLQIEEVDQEENIPKISMHFSTTQMQQFRDASHECKA